MALLSDLIPALRQHTAILVTGPQRSGTTIGARILAMELGRRYVDENEIQIANVARSRNVLSGTGVVLQAPALCHVAHTFSCAVVLMRRCVADIVRSQDRIGWGVYEPVELAKYEVDRGPIAEVKYCAWNDWQKDQCAAPYELEYESLRGHPLWVNPQLRQEFAARQWANPVNDDEAKTSIV